MNDSEQNDCLFCKFVDGSVSTPGIFWEDDTYMAFLSIFPNTLGFSVVIPKQHYPSDVLAMPDANLQDFVLAAKKAAKMLENTFEDVGRVGLMMEGTGINHAHIKLFPMHDTPELKNGGWKPYHSDKEFWFEEYPGWFASADGPRATDEEISEIAQKIKDAN